MGSTLFWAGSTYAPSFMVDGQADGKVNIQEYLQAAFLGSIQKLNEAVGDLDGVLGIEVSCLSSVDGKADVSAYERTPPWVHRSAYHPRMGT